MNSRHHNDIKSCVDDQGETDSQKVVEQLREFAAVTANRIRTGQDPVRIIADGQELLKRLAESLAPPKIKVWSSAELDAADLRTNYLIEDILAANQPCVLAASKKSLKTTIAIDLTLSLASKLKFLGQFYVTSPVRVALMSGESGDAVIQETARRIAKSKPWKSLSDYDNAIWSFDLPKLGQPQTKAELSRFIRDNALKVLVIDPAYLCLDLGDDAGNLFSVGPKLLELTEIGRDTECTIVIVHHNKKASRETQFATPELESIAWSGFQEWARQWILLGRREAYDPEQAGSHKLWLVSGGSAGHSGNWAVDVEEGSQKDEGGRRWDVVIQKASVAIADKIDLAETEKERRQQQRGERQVWADCEKILRFLCKNTGGDTQRIIAEKTSLSNARASAAIEKLIEDSKVEQFDLNKNNRQYAGYRRRESTGNAAGMTENIPACPGEVSAMGISPSRGIPVPTHRDNEQSLFMDGEKL